MSTRNSAKSNPHKASARHFCRLGLGTVQFGMDYGISNVLGQCSLDDTKRILSSAAEAGIRLLDTAPSYGEAEEAIGEASEDKTGFDIVTKTIPVKAESIDRKVVAQVMNRVDESYRHLGCRGLYGILVHQSEDVLKPGGELLFDALRSLKEQGKVSKIGVSIYHAAQIDAVLDRYDIDLIQLPINVFDQRLLKSGHLSELSSKGVEIHARSVFLQGLLLMEIDELPSHLSSVCEHFRNFRQAIARHGITALQAALGFVRHIAELDKILIGVNSQEHLAENLDAFISAKEMDYSSFAFEDESVLNPGEWALR